MKVKNKTKLYNLSCRYFLGDKPCRFNEKCSGCQYFKPIRNKILIIKLESLGDVLRTTPILWGLREKFPSSRITWITAKEATPLLENNPLIDRLLPFELESIVQLQAEAFSQVICLDKSKYACGLASLINAKIKKGFGLTRLGNIYPFNKDADYAFRLGIDDDLKFRKNKFSYQEIIFEVAGLKFKGERYILKLNDRQKALSQRINRKIRPNAYCRVIGISKSCGNKFPLKKWPEENYFELIELLSKDKDKSVVLLGAEVKGTENRRWERRGRGNVFCFDTSHDIRDFAALINCCDLIVTPDTLTMHIGIGLGKKVIALFGPTSATEIDVYGQGEKIISNLECSPCYKNICKLGGICMKNITAKEIFNRIITLLKKTGI